MELDYGLTPIPRWSAPEDRRDEKKKLSLEQLKREMWRVPFSQASEEDKRGILAERGA